MGTLNLHEGITLIHINIKNRDPEMKKMELADKHFKDLLKTGSKIKGKHTHFKERNWRSKAKRNF